jgi:hypothetical protein
MARGSTGVKKTASSNGLGGKLKKIVKKASSSDDEVSATAVDVGSESVAEPAPVKVAKAKKTKKSLRAVESSGSAGGRVRKAPERYEARNPPPGPANKRAKTGPGNSKEFPVEAIRGIKKEGGSYSFLVKWEGYAEKSNNWEPEANVRQCKANITKFLDQVSKHVNTFP